MKNETISDRITAYIMLCSDEELSNRTVKDIAKNFGMNASYISREFLEDKKFRLKDYLLRMRLFRAAAILRIDMDIPVDEVAKKMGFSTTGSFSDAFKQVFGASPAKYREYRQ